MIQSKVINPIASQSQRCEQASPVSSKENGKFPQNATETGSFGQAKGNKAPVAAMSYVNPPEVQRMVIEHVVRSEAPVSSMNASFRLRVFSGRTCPNHEVDFDTWRNSVELILKDPAVSDVQRSRKILDSLVSPAANVVKPLGLQALPTAYLELLDSAFGIVEDGDELFAVFLNTFQNSGEKPSQYLHRLQTVLSRAQKRGGVSATEVDKHLLRQFCRGCWEDVLITDLQLERKRDNPPPFPEMLLQLRVEEDKRSAKENRMKKHFGAPKQKVSAHVLAVNSLENDKPLETDITEIRKQIADLKSQLTGLEMQKAEPKVSSPDAVVAELQKQVAELRSQLTHTNSQKMPKTKINTTALLIPVSSIAKAPGHLQSTADQKPSSRPKPWYCFRCGEDGHIATACCNEPNTALVAAKKTQLKEKQSRYDFFPAFKLNCGTNES
ncbi:zinc finger CCHC domain-containing protein 12-like [Pleuronectes platessa]|uniref:zinc finger CCHC domain-containing protein 12-like n=1 Tax=Pleuronectes platessa TaxID=8262 RepID=UPI00232A348F|nr:zinc finger CCHC domain-containing protein 12-like [Pleuronectes platessa]